MKFNRRVRKALAHDGFTVQPWPISTLLGEDNYTFRKGTMHGLIGCDDHTLLIIAIMNDTPGNGQFATAMEGLEAVSKRRLLFVEMGAIFNARLYRHLMEKRGYLPHANRPGHLVLHTK